MFLRKADYYSLIQEDELDVIIEDSTDTPDTAFLIDAESAALSEVESYLRHIYDVAIIFASIAKWDSAANYVLDDVVYYEPNNKTYKSLTSNTNAQPDISTSDWVEITDPRDAMMRMYVRDITLYHLHSRINPRNIPELRAQRRDEAVKWLRMVSKGDITVNLPLIDSTSQSGYRIMFGGEDPVQNNY